MTQTGWLRRDGLNLAVHGGGSDGPPMIFQHGLCGDARQVAEAMAGLAPQRWQALECRGHGASDLDETVSIPAFSADVAALIERAGEPVVLGGISMGAAIATHIAVHRPDLVRALVLVRPVWMVGPAPRCGAPNAEVGALLAKLPPDEARARFAASETAHRLGLESPDNLASLMGFFQRQPLAQTARLLSEIARCDPGFSIDDLKQIDHPTLVCGCAEDAIHPLPIAKATAQLIPGAIMVELPPKGRDKPAHLAALAAAIRHFLQEL